MQPDFSHVDYWNTRFLAETIPFEWLKHPDGFLPYIKTALGSIPEDLQDILHIGPGSSTLSLALRGLISDPHKIHNLDYSERAVERGQGMEQNAFGDSSNRFMKWTCGDILDRQCVLKLKNNDRSELGYTLIVDKSTTDAIACGPDLMLEHRWFRTGSSPPVTNSHGTRIEYQELKAHPVSILALHLATLTGPGAQWLCLSYSSERFPFYPEQTNSADMGVYDPARYWLLQSMEAVPLEEVEDIVSTDTVPVHRPQTTLWLYTLRRTETNLALVNLGFPHSG